MAGQWVALALAMRGLEEGRTHKRGRNGAGQPHSFVQYPIGQPYPICGPPNWVQTAVDYCIWKPRWYCSQSESEHGQDKWGSNLPLSCERTWVTSSNLSFSLISLIFPSSQGCCEANVRWEQTMKLNMMVCQELNHPPSFTSVLGRRKRTKRFIYSRVHLILGNGLSSAEMESCCNLCTTWHSSKLMEAKRPLNVFSPPDCGESSWWVRY